MHSRFRKLPALALALSIGCTAGGTGGAVEVYRYVDGNGRVHFTDRPPHDGYRLIRKGGKEIRTARIDIRNRDANRKRFAAKIAEVARRYRVPEALVHAVIAIESAYDPNAVSRAGAVGLMQLMPATARRYGVANRRDPAANLSGGVRYLRDLLSRFDSNVELTLAGYNAGENAVEKFGNRVPPYAETQNYVRKVMLQYSRRLSGSVGDN